MRLVFVYSGLRAAALVGAAVAALCIAPASPAAAQSLFDALFGAPKPPPPPPPGYGQPARLLPPGYQPPAGYPLRLPLSPYAPIRPPYDADDGESPRPSKGSRLRTVCVRMCDGYYWPVSFATTRDRLSRDADACRASCGEEARLFYMPSAKGEIEEAVDLTGRVYARLPNAFRYRKALVDGCACRPAPWSDAERSRHEGYALNSNAERSPAAQAMAESTVKVFNAAGDELHGPPMPPDLDQALAIVDTQRTPRTRPVASDIRPRDQLVQRASARPAAPDRRRPQNAAHPAASGGSWLGPGNTQLIWPGDKQN